MDNELISLSSKIDGLPGDIFRIKNDYLFKILDNPSTDLEASFVKIGKAGERLAKGILESKGIHFDDQSSFDRLIQGLSDPHTPTPISVGLRTVLKYRNQAAHDNSTNLSIYDLDAAVSAFCAAYHASVRYLESFSSLAMESSKVPQKSPTELSDTSQASSIQTPYHFRPAIQDIITAFLCFFTAVLLIKAIVYGGPSSFFILLRLDITAVSIFLLIRHFKEQKRLFLPIHLGLSILFNPFFLIVFSRDTWKIIDMLVLGWFCFLGYLFLKKKSD